MERIEQLIRTATDGDAPVGERHRAFGELVKAYQDLAYGCARAVLRDADLAADAAQEAFVTAWQELPRLREPAAFPGWLRRLVLTRCSRLTRRAGVDTVPLREADGLPDAAADPHDRLESAEFRRGVLDAVWGLAEPERMVVTLFYVNQSSQKEIAAFLEVPVTTVQRRLYSARRRLRSRLRDFVPERAIAMVQENLRQDRPSRDDRFARTVQLFNAAASGDAATVGELLQEDPELARSTHRGQWGDRTPLHLAAEKGHLEVARLLLGHGADVHARDQGDHATPLHWAAGEGHLELARLLVGQGADVNATGDMHERGPLGWAVVLSGSHPEMAEYLISQGARVDVFAAIALEQAERVRELVREDPGVLEARMSVCEDYRRPLHFAVSKDRPAMVELLLDLGADSRARTPSGRTPLCVAVEEDRPAIRDLLLSRGVEVDLLSALALGDDVAADRLLAAGIEPEVRDAALLAAAHHGRAKQAERLVALGADVNTRGQAGWMRGVTPLIAAANGNHREIARLLLERGADATIRDEYPGATALHYAAWNGDVETARRLIARGVDVHLKDSMYDADPLGWAVENRQQAALDFFLENGAELDVSRAAYAGRLDLVRDLLDRDSAALNARGSFGTALHQAALHGYTEIVRLLLERGADPSVPNRYGDSVLTMVRKARQGLLHPSNLPVHEEIERLLVEHGAS